MRPEDREAVAVVNRAVSGTAVVAFYSSEVDARESGSVFEASSCMYCKRSLHFISFAVSAAILTLYAHGVTCKVLHSIGQKAEDEATREVDAAILTTDGPESLEAVMHADYTQDQVTREVDAASLTMNDPEFPEPGTAKDVIQDIRAMCSFILGIGVAMLSGRASRPDAVVEGQEEFELLKRIHLYLYLL